MVFNASIYKGKDTTPSWSLGDILMSVADTFGDTLPVTSKADGADLADFMAEVLPDYDRERVRDADIRKLVSWYTILRQYAPETFEKTEEAPAADAEAATNESIAAEEDQAAE